MVCVPKASLSHPTGYFAPLQCHVWKWPNFSTATRYCLKFEFIFTVFFRIPCYPKVTKLVRLPLSDQLELDKEITALRDGLRAKVNRLNDLEGRPDVVGFGLKPLSRGETAAVRQVLGDRL